VIEAELDLHSTFDGVDTGTFRTVGSSSRRPQTPTTPSLTGPASSDQIGDQP